MLATIQVKMALDKADALKRKLEELQAASKANMDAVEKKLKAKNLSAKDRERLMKQLAVMEATHKELNMSNLMRAMVESGLLIAKNLSAEQLLAAILKVRVPIGRPSTQAVPASQMVVGEND